MPEIFDAIFIQEITVIDPETKGDVQVEMWKDPVSGGIFGIDSSFLESEDIKVIASPFNRSTQLRLGNPQ